MGRRRHGFTLIELLVVIAIIAILAAMLFPVFARARESARKIQCLANVKNIAMAVQMYISDYGRLFPAYHSDAGQYSYENFWSTQPGGDGVGASEWGGCCYMCNANPYLRKAAILEEYIKNRDVWRCPSARHTITPEFIVPSYGPGGWQGYLAQTEGSWGTNGPSGPCARSYPPSWGGSVTDSIAQQTASGPDTNAQEITISIPQGIAEEKKESEVSDPSYFVVCADSTNRIEVWHQYGVLYEPCGITYWCPCGDALGECDLSGYTQDQFWSDGTIRNRVTRHMGGSNLGFLDGHAAWWHADAIRAAIGYDVMANSSWQHTSVKLEGVPL